ncbi:acyl-CoA dehydrogenase [Streptomyces alkaliphilus]|uniref:acyl-CoA dehydrogenase n=1 Tax=Streptomyces alkaliphilus TaxID=1472722 RepID=UPI00117F69CA|nr:acyl-CoA dehydrogenase [Streptomyces alkaliphilus]MQS06817.1 acyl-CoA dehydrogenase [Streptomyces alkaliphilus]
MTDVLHSPPPGVGAWDRVVRDLADDLAMDAVERDRAGAPPFDETARLRESGLLAALTVPPGTERDPSWEDACAVVRAIAVADSSVAELLARHHVLSRAGHFLGSPERAFPPGPRTGDRAWLLVGDLGAGSVAESARLRHGSLTITPIRGGYVLNGRRRLATGVPVADRLVLGAVCSATGDTRVVLVDPDAEGVETEPLPEHERAGQRAGGAGLVDFQDVTLGAEALLGVVEGDGYRRAPSAGLAPLATALMLVQVALGTAEGALAEARDAILAGHRVHLPDTLDDDPVGEPTEEADLLHTWGELATSLHVASTVADRAGAAMGAALRRGGRLTAADRAEVAVLVATTEAVVAEAVPRITARVTELADTPGLDRHWRNARLLIGRGSAARRFRDIGSHFLYPSRGVPADPG